MSGEQLEFASCLCIGPELVLRCVSSHGMKAQAPRVRVAELLLLADRADEVRLIQTAASENRLTVVEACEAVLKFLRRENEYAKSPRPHLILLNLDLSRDEHCDTLREIKMDPAFRRIPIVVLIDGAGAKAEQAYDLRANACVRKPADPDEFVRTIRSTLAFWLMLARLPGDDVSL